MKTLRIITFQILFLLTSQILFAVKPVKIDPRATAMIEKINSSVALTDSQKTVLLVHATDYFASRDLGGKVKTIAIYKNKHKESSLSFKEKIETILTEDQLKLLKREPQPIQNGNQ